MTVGFMAFHPVTQERTDVCISFKNDTGSSVTLHDGSGTIPMSGGTTKKLCKPEGTKIYFADRGRKGELILEFDDSLDGKKVDLSDYQ
ncbi:MAG: hypothetical protein ACFB0B_05685 [Thermonemataceae bacterium]